MTGTHFGSVSLTAKNYAVERRNNGSWESDYWLF